MRVNFTSSIINKDLLPLKCIHFLQSMALKNTETKAIKTNFVIDKIKELYQKAGIINRQTFWREGFKLPSEMLFSFCNILSQI